MMLLRVVLLFILFMLIAKLAKNLVNFLNLPQRKNQEKPAQKVRNFNSEEIEDIDYKEVKRKNG